MKKELEERLFNDFPLLYRDKNKSMRESCLFWRFECGDGWYEIIRRASLELERQIAEMIPEVQKNPDIKCYNCGCSKHDHRFVVDQIGKGVVSYHGCTTVDHVPYQLQKNRLLPYLLLTKREVKAALKSRIQFKFLFWNQMIVNRFWRHGVIKKADKFLRWIHKKFGIGYNRPCFCKEFEYPLPKAVQIKEKMGGLRIYINHGNEKMFQIIRRAEEESFITCEDCGKPGRERFGGWIRTLCDECEREYGRRS
jgi:hypothetical protein